MKKSDIAMIILIAAVSILTAYFVTSSFIPVSNQDYSQDVKTIDAIDTSVIEPSTDIFSKDAINPAVEVQISSGATTL